MHSVIPVFPPKNLIFSPLFSPFFALPLSLPPFRSFSLISRPFVATPAPGINAAKRPADRFDASLRPRRTIPVFGFKLNNRDALIFFVCTCQSMRFEILFLRLNDNFHHWYSTFKSCSSWTFLKNPPFGKNTQFLFLRSFTTKICNVI